MKKNLSAIFAENMESLLFWRDEDTVSAAKKAKIDQKTVWNYTQSDKANPTLKKVEALADALKVHPSLMLIEGAFEAEIPDGETLELMRKVIELSPNARRQVREFVELWERPKENK